MMKLKQDLAWKHHRYIHRPFCFRLGAAAPRPAAMKRRPPLLGELEPEFPGSVFHARRGFRGLQVGNACRRRREDGAIDQLSTALPADHAAADQVLHVRPQPPLRWLVKPA
eukprot:2898218-Pyramimonas_sp.AAC.1